MNFAITATYAGLFGLVFLCSLSLITVAGWMAHAWVTRVASAADHADRLARGERPIASPDSGGAVGAWGLRIAVALGVALSLAIGTLRIVTGTPLYVYDASVIRRQIARLREAFPSTRLLFAAKALTTVGILELMRAEGFAAYHFDGGLKSLMRYYEEQDPALKALLDAGADLITTNSFNATAVAQGDYQLAGLAAEFNLAPGQLADDTPIKKDLSANLYELAGPIMTIENFFRTLLQDELASDNLSVDSIVDKLMGRQNGAVDCSVINDCACAA